MDFRSEEHTAPTLRRRSFVVRALSAVAAGVASGHLLRRLAHGAPREGEARAGVTIRPHPDAVSRTSPRPPSHE